MTEDNMLGQASLHDQMILLAQQQQQDMAARSVSMSSPSRSSIRSLSELTATAIVQAGDLFGPIPNLFKWLASQVAEIEAAIDVPPNLFVNRTNIAMTKDEQNMEIIFLDSQYYLEAMHAFKVQPYELGAISKSQWNLSTTSFEMETPKAWLGREIEDKLILKPSRSWLNGARTYFCLMCNFFSPYSNLLQLHMLLTCPKMADAKKMAAMAAAVAGNANTHEKRIQTKQAETCEHRKRGFDILSLLSKGDKVSEEEGEEDKDDEDEEEKIDVEAIEEDDLPSLSAQSFQFKKKKLPKSAKLKTNVCVEKKMIKNVKKVRSVEEQSRLKQTRLASSHAALNLDNLQGLYHNTNPISCGLASQLIASTFANLLQEQSNGGGEQMNFPPPMSSLLSLCPYPPNGNLESLGLGQPPVSTASCKHSMAQAGHMQTSSSSSTLLSSSSSPMSLSPDFDKSSACARKLSSPPSSSPLASGNGGAMMNLPPYFMPPSGVPNPLLSSIYLMSPSLTALSYQSSNVCAYCNTAFRMTSDLVYHMRSHHKSTVKEEKTKKRREEALRCNICNETFKERHHLTRHMTSHQ